MYIGIHVVTLQLTSVCVCVCVCVLHSCLCSSTCKLVKHTIESFHWVRTSVFFHYTADVLVSNNVQWSMGKKHFHHHYRATQAANCSSLAYYNTDYSIFNIYEPRRVSFVYCPIAMAKVLFPHSPGYIVGHQHVCCVTEEYGRVRSVKPLYTQQGQAATQVSE